MKTRIVLTVCLLLVLLPIASYGEVWNLVSDFSATENPNGAWSFGWRPTEADPLTLYTDTSQWDVCPPDANVHHWNYELDRLALNVSKNSNDHVWSCNGCDFSPGVVWFHPGPTQQGVVRWTAPSNIRIDLEAHFRALDTGSTIVRVYRNGSQLWSATLPDYGATAACSLIIACQAGDQIDVAVDAISFTDDSVGLDLAIGSPVGACCFSNGVCLQGTQADCQSLGGNYVGDGVPCDPDPCGPTPVKNTTWGQVKTLYR